MRRLAVAALAALLCVDSFACTNLIVGKKASADGSVMCSYNCDEFGGLEELFHYPAGRHAAGEWLRYGSNPDGTPRLLPQAPYTYGVVGLMNDMRDHYEGSALDMTADVSAGPWASPYRNALTNFKAPDGTDMFRERPIGCQQTSMTHVCQMRDWLPDAVGGVTWFNLDDANMVAYVPAYCGIDRIPKPFLRETTSLQEFNPESAFWMNNFVANMIYPRYSAMIGDLRDAQKELEDYYENDQKEVEKAVSEMTPAEAVPYLTGKTEAYTQMMMKRWEKLAYLLIVKHNDQSMQPSENGVVVPGKRSLPEYSPVFVDAVKNLTGQRYVKPEVVVIPER